MLDYTAVSTFAIEVGDTSRFFTGTIMLFSHFGCSLYVFAASEIARKR